MSNPNDRRPIAEVMHFRGATMHERFKLMLAPSGGINTQLSERGLRIAGDAGIAKVVEARGLLAQKACDMQLHLHDLRCVLAFGGDAGSLREPDSAQADRLRSALWFAAIVTFYKCFGRSNGRTRLDANVIYKDDVQALADFAYFKNRRDKNMVHDENTWLQSMMGAVLNHPGSEPKVARVLCVGVQKEGLSRAEVVNLERLVRRAMSWAQSEFDGLCEQLQRELEEQSYEQLQSLPEMHYDLPTDGDAHSPKPRIRNE